MTQCRLSVQHVIAVCKVHHMYGTPQLVYQAWLTKAPMLNPGVKQSKACQMWADQRDFPNTDVQTEMYFGMVISLLRQKSS